MTAPAHTVAIVGASLAGLKVAEQARRSGFEGRLVLIGDEPHVPYDRPPLSKKVLLGQATLDDLALRTQPWDELDVELRLGTAATALDGSNRVVSLADGTSVEADHVFICTGVRARQLPSHGPRAGLHVIRTWEDAVAVRERMVPATTVVIAGGGFIGAEAAAVAVSLGCRAVLVEPGPTLMLRGLGDRWGRHAERLHRDRGVDVRTGTTIATIEGDEQVEAVVLSDGERIETRLVVVGIGATPNTEWLDGSGVAVDDGVVTDAFGQTSVPRVWAVGDVARFRHERYGRAMRVEHWTNAVEMARAVTINALEPDKRAPFDTIPMVWSDQFEFKIQIAGLIEPGFEERVVLGSPEEGEFLALYGSPDGLLMGAISFNRAAMLVRMKQNMARGATLEQAVAFTQRGRG